MKRFIRLIDSYSEK